MAIISTKYSDRREIPPYPQIAGVVVAYRFEFDVPTTVANGDIIELGQMPAFNTLVDAIFDADDLDSGTAMVIDVGMMTGEVGAALDEAGAARTCGQEIFAASTLGQAGGVVRPTAKTAFRIAKDVKDRSVGVKIVTKAGTAVAGKIGLTLLYAA